MSDTFEDIKQSLDPEKRYFYTYLDGIRITIRQLLQKQGLTQKELAERSGVDEQKISAIMNKKPNLTLQTVSKLSNALGHHLIYPQFDKYNYSEDEKDQTEVVASNEFNLDV